MTGKGEASRCELAEAAGLLNEALVILSRTCAGEALCYERVAREGLD